jgi:uncharacterized protein YjbI with pentapeptide repeats
MIAPQLAAVRPRVVIPDEGTSLLVDEVAARLERGATGLITLTGPQGCGRTTALEHLEQVFLGEPRLLLVEDVFDAVSDDLDFKLVICTSPVSYRACEKWKLAPWTRDDCIEYLLAVHPEHCASVVARIDERGIRLGGSPELWRGVLDRLAANEDLPGVREVLREELLARLVKPAALDAARAGSLLTVCRPELESKQFIAWLKNENIGRRACCWLRHEPVRLLVAADEMYAFLRSGAVSRTNADADRDFAQIPLALVRQTAALLADDTDVLDALRAILRHGPRTRLPLVVSLLHAAGQECRPQNGKSPILNAAYLAGVAWRGAKLPYANMQFADFRQADLREADLLRADASGADFTQANLHGARLGKLIAERAIFAGADLRYVRANGALFPRADVRAAQFDGALLKRSDFYAADLRDARFVRANLVWARLEETQIEGADFTAADLSAARLAGLTLRLAEFGGAKFDDANLEKCDLEGMALPGSSFRGANLQNALLTGTRIPEGKFRDADLRGAGLADIEWERADLRDADLRNCTFHLGSSRSGLVDSPLASEGTRTGFYTDELHEQDFKAPEEIRKANLRGADLRGADVEHTDFYLVDLRDARYTREQEDHFRRTGAILETRV